MHKVCRCGKVVKDVCECCKPMRQQRASGTTTERGYGDDHRRASERYRNERPLCERCVMLFGVIDANPTEHMHHIQPISVQPGLRMKRSNWLALCKIHHEELERDVMAGVNTKHWSDSNYEQLLEAK